MHKVGLHVLLFEYNHSLWLFCLVLLLNGCASKKSAYEVYFPPGLEPTIGTNKTPLLHYSATFSNNVVSVQEIELETTALTAGEVLPKNWMTSSYHFNRLRCFQASDGLSYLVDHHEMALYYRHGTKVWTNAIKNIPIIKTFGGSPPHLHIRYLGANKFLFPETLPQKNEPVHWTKAETDSDTGWTKRPSRECVTLLFDCVEKRILDRSQPEVYQTEPSITLSDEWKNQYGIRFEPWWMQHDPGQVGFMRPHQH